MKKLRWLDEYGGQSTAELIALAGSYRVDSIVVAFDQALGQKCMRSPLTDEEQFVVAIEAMENQVNNGGFGQLFVNEPDVALHLLDALNAIGCPKTRSVCAAAMQHLGITPGTAVEEVRQSAERLAGDARMEACDEGYFASGEEVSGRLFEFIRANQDRIVVPG